MDIKKEAEKVMWALVRLMKTQKAVAKALGANKQTFNYWFNHAQKIPHQQFLAMQALLKKKQASLQNNIPISIEPNEKAEQKTANLKFSQKIKTAMTFEQALGQRQGQRSDKTSFAFQPRRTCGEVKGRTDAFIAKKFNFKSRAHYVRAKKVVLSDITELIDAMDSEMITVHHAERLSRYSSALVKQLLLQGKKAVKDYLKFQLFSKAPPAKLPCPSKYIHTDIFTDKKLLKAEQKYCLPLRLIFMGLLACCDACGAFDPNEEKLKKFIFPYLNIDFKKILKALCHVGFFKKNQLNGKFYCRPFLFKQFVHELNNAKVLTPKP